MKNFKLMVIVLLSFALISPPSSAAKSEIKWNNPEKYRDIKAGDENRKAFKARVYKTFEKHFAKLAEKLPENQTLKIEINDIDLAGDVNIGGGINRIRIITDLYFPRMKFSYNLLNADNTSAKAGEINLKDMSFMLGSNLRYRNDSFGYDKKMIAEWFKDTFKDDFVSK